MARDRQRAKQRQAERRAQRQADQARPPGAPEPDAGPADGDGAGGVDSRRGRRAERAGVPGSATNGPVEPPGLDPRDAADLAASAPPEDLGRSSAVVETPAPPRAADASEDDEAAAAAARENAGEGKETADAAKHGKVVAFLIAVWAELKRVQWPNRQQVITLTGIVLGFVVIMGAYLGALDAVFSRLVQLVI